MRVAFVSDFHYPGRCEKLILLEELQRENPDLIIGLGDYTEEVVIEALKSIAPFKGVKGNVDGSSVNLPNKLVITVDELKICAFHSSEIYPRGDVCRIYHFWKDEKPDIIAFGHTHRLYIGYVENVLLINPGSFNGVPSGEGTALPPSFVVLDTERSEIKVVRK